MIYDGIITKPPMEEIIEHGWLKDQAAKIHKYLKRWKNKAGKWVYQYNAKKDKNAKATSAYENEQGFPGSQRNSSKYAKTNLNNPYFRWVNSFQGVYNKDTTAGIAAGRQRTKKTSAMKGDSRYKRAKTNLSTRGYSGSQGSGESRRLSNLGTRRSSKDSYYWDETRMNAILDRQDRNGGFKIGNSNNTIKKNKAPKKFQERMAKKSARKARSLRPGTLWSSPGRHERIQNHRNRPSWTYR